MFSLMVGSSTPAKAGVQNALNFLDSRLHGNDGKWLFSTLCETITVKTINMRKSTLFLIFISLSGVSLAMLLVLHPALSGRHHMHVLESKKSVVKELRLTDLCLFTEARYTRHPSQADLHSAFQDHPLALEHFPSGSMVLPPASLWMRRRDGSPERNIRQDEQ
jgi:hypothetical protein